MGKKRKMMDRKQRREALRKRQQQESKNRNADAAGGSFLDLSEYDNVSFYDLKLKKNTIDIIPYIVASKNHPQQVAKGEEDYKLDVWVHNNVGPANIKVVCPLKTYNKPCPICEDHAQRLEDGEDWKDKKLAAIRPKRRCIYNVIDTKDPKKGVQLLNISHAWFEKEVYDKAEFEDEAFVAFADIEDGYTITFRGVEEKYEGRTFIKPKDFGFKERDPYDEDVFDEVFPLDKLMKLMSYEELESLHYGLNEDDDSDDDDEETEKKVSKKTKRDKKRPSRKSKYQDDSDDDDDENQDDDDDDSDDDDDDSDDDDGDDDDDCPEGHVFGGDHGNTEDCDDCDEETFEVCQKLHKKLLKERKKNKNKTSSKRPVRRNKNR